MADDEQVDVGAIHRKSTGKMGRRGLMKLAASVGFTGYTAAHLTAEDVRGAASDQVPIKTTIEQDRTEYVPRDWYNRYQRARRVNERHSFVSRHEDVIAQWMVPPKRGGANEKLVVEIDQEGDDRPGARAVVPERKDGVPVEIEEMKRAEPEGCSSPSAQNYNTGDYNNPCPGGIAITDRECHTGTLGPLARHKSNEKFDPHKFWMTVKHLYPDSNDGDCRFGLENTYQPYNLEDFDEEAIGYIEEQYNEFDTVVNTKNISHGTSGVTPAPEIAAPSNAPQSSNYQVGGSWTEDQIANMAGNGETTYHVGTRTGFNSGPVKKMNGTVCYDFNCGPLCIDKQVQWGDGNDTAGGDSGGPVFSDAYGDVRMLCHHSGYSYGLSGAYNAGTAIYAIYNNYGFYCASD